jgi:TPR repeat protein
MHVTFAELVLAAVFCALMPLVWIAGSRAFYARRYRQAAESGSIEAQGSLGLKHAAGFNVSQDLVEAYKWLTLAAERASGLDQQTYAKARDSVAEELSPAQIEDAQRLARHWLEAFQRKQRSTGRQSS